MKSKSYFIFLLLICIILSGCANARLLLRKGQKELKLKPDEGGVIFSFQASGPTRFKVQSVNIQEINQYKEYSKKPLLITPLTGHNSAVLFSLKLPKGTYKIATFRGLLKSTFFWSNYYLLCNRVFDVSSGEIKYIGRIRGSIYATYSDIAVLESFYEDDVSAFLEKFPVLQGQTIKKEIMY